MGGGPRQQRSTPRRAPGRPPPGRIRRPTPARALPQPDDTSPPSSPDGAAAAAFMSAADAATTVPSLHAEELVTQLHSMLYSSATGLLRAVGGQALAPPPAASARKAGGHAKKKAAPRPPPARQRSFLKADLAALADLGDDVPRVRRGIKSPTDRRFLHITQDFCDTLLPPMPIIDAGRGGMDGEMPPVAGVRRPLFRIPIDLVDADGVAWPCLFKSHNAASQYHRR